MKKTIWEGGGAGAGRKRSLAVECLAENSGSGGLLKRMKSKALRTRST